MLDTLRVLRASEGVGEETCTPHMHKHTRLYCKQYKMKFWGGENKLFSSFTKRPERWMWINGGEAQGDEKWIEGRELLSVTDLWPPVAVPAATESGQKAIDSIRWRTLVMTVWGWLFSLPAIWFQDLSSPFYLFLISSDSGAIIHLY